MVLRLNRMKKFRELHILFACLVVITIILSHIKLYGIFGARKYERKAEANQEETLTNKDVRKHVNKVKVIRISDIPMDQEEMEVYMSKFLQVVVTCRDSYSQSSITLKNTGLRNIPFGGWSLYFNQLGPLSWLGEINDVGPHSCGYKIQNLGGTFHRMEIDCDTDLSAKDEMVLEIPAVVLNDMGSYARLCNGWYVAFDDGTTTKRLKYQINIEGKDKFSPQDRFDWAQSYGVSDSKVILPSPKLAVLSHDNFANIIDWTVCSDSEIFTESVQTMTTIFEHLIQSESRHCPEENSVRFIKTASDKNEDEKYSIKIAKNKIEIVAASDRGGFYAIQTLRSLAEATEDGSLGYNVPTGTIEDEPRFSYRSVMIDPARNFIPKRDVISLIETMGIYKLNKLHLHLTDDEGWRLAIPGLPELTSVGGSRCHGAKDGRKCLQPQYGSGPDHFSTGSGYYTVSDYQDILRVAEENKVEVIPEIDFPGHSNAAIKAMAYRYERFVSKLEFEKAKEFLLSKGNLKSQVSIQNFPNNMVDPCLPSTYRFIEHVVGEIVKIHARVQPLRKIHLGGDEVPNVENYDSETCKKFIEERQLTDESDISIFFTIDVVARVKAKHKIGVVTWQESSNQYFQLGEEVHGKELYSNVWKTVNKQVTTAYANHGFKIVLSVAQSLYLDFRAEPDSNEVGLTWAAPYVSDQTVFNFRPDQYYIASNETDAPDHRENIVGMQAHLWGELVTNVDVFQSQLYPRLLPFAERAWNKAEWEDTLLDYDGEEVDENNLRGQDWESFANMVGYKELKRLKKRGINYRIPPPGVREIEDTLYANTMYPGFVIMYQVQCSADQQTTFPCMWRIYDENKPPLRTVDYDSESRIKFVTVDGPRRSREIEFDFERNYI